ncbi:MAG TPA: sensor histidine kinase [Nocardioides sp.]|nr:sensor histidine kinase [Nocardioides sp.]
MSRTRRLVVLAAAWAIPVVWVVVALLSGPSDGTTISRAWPAFGADQWGDSASVVRTYGETPLREGDIILTIDGRTFGDWAASGSDPDRADGDGLQYEVRRPAAQLDRILVLEVTLTSYPIADAVSDNVAAVAVAVMLLAAGSIVFWHSPRAASARAFLLATALLPAGLTSYPFGLGAVDVAGGRGVWPQLVGELVLALAFGTMLVTALTFLSTPERLRRHPWAYVTPYVVPLVGYAVWVLAVADRQTPEAARLQAMLAVAVPALVATGLVILAVLVRSYLRAGEREDRLAVRLVLLAVGGGLGVRLLLGDIPQRLAGEPLVPWGLLTLLVVPVVLGCLITAMLRYRLDEIEPTVRRALVHACVATVVGGAFLSVVGAVNLASDSSVESMLAGGVVALLLLPLAVALQRAMRRLVYGDREFPHRVVADLRRLDPLTAPTDALEETLTLLARRLRLSYAAIEVFGTGPADRIETSIGASRGSATTVDLVVGGASLGRLRLEVAPSRDPFGPGDRRLLEDVGSQVGALVQAVSINRELQRSRQHLITAREEERRRVRRDLHDGLGPSLATLAMGLEAAGDLIADDPARAADLVGRLSEQTRADIAEVRRLVDGLRPPALDQFGLVSALRQRADEHNLAARTGGSGPRMTWAVEAGDDLEPLPAAVEVAAYRIVVEAVNNALQHSAAETCAVTLRRDQGSLHIRISDAGVGLAPSPVMGVGLASMKERAEELGGSCTLTSASGVGTVIEARLPLDGMTRPDGSR